MNPEQVNILEKEWSQEKYYIYTIVVGKMKLIKLSFLSSVYIKVSFYRV
jgi:hypothetical protein